MEAEDRPPDVNLLLLFLYLLNDMWGIDRD